MTNNEWIKTKDQLPDEPDDYLVFGMGLVSTLEFRSGKWWSDVHMQFVDSKKITHWMPLPEPPKI